MVRRCGLLLMSAAVFLAAGCSQKGTVSGQVTLNGAPVRGGVVTFLGEDNQPRIANINSEGEYSVTGVPLGTARITVTSLGTSVAMPRTMYALRDLHGLPQPPAAAPQLPRKYANPENGLTWVVEKGDQKFDIALTP
jgi:hypothetical protein